ncbi:MAG: hypothetical protein GY756_10165 [bacterium]|nr:hypothetical protein [bacterium]
MKFKILFSLLFLISSIAFADPGIKKEGFPFTYENGVFINQKSNFMKIKFGAIVTDGRGKLGGHVFSKNASGSYIRTKVTPVNPQTSPQTAVRALFGSISQGWSVISELNRNTWNGAVESWSTTDIFGDLKNPTGKALYQRLNTQAQSVGFNAMSAAPAKTDMTRAALTEAEINLADSAVNLTTLDNSGDFKVAVYATPKLSQGTKFVKDKLRRITFALSDVIVPADIYTAYVARFGAPVVGDNIYFGVKYIAENGQATIMQTIKAVIPNP